jgi:hypothetical protein
LGGDIQYRHAWRMGDGIKSAEFGFPRKIRPKIIATKRYPIVMANE